MSVPNVPAAKCCTDSSASNCYGQNFSEEQKNTRPVNPFDNTYSCCRYVNQESNVVCTQTSSMDCSGIWTAQEGLNDDLPALEVIDNYWQANFDVEEAKLTEYCMSPHLFLAIDNHQRFRSSSTIDGVKYALFGTLFSVREMQALYHVDPSSLTNNEDFITRADQVDDNFDTRVDEYVRNFGGVEFNNTRSNFWLSSKLSSSRLQSVSDTVCGTQP